MLSVLISPVLISSANVRFISVNLGFLVPVYSRPQILNLPRSLQTPGPDYKKDAYQASAFPADGSTAFSLCVKDGILVLMTHRQRVGGKKSRSSPSASTGTETIQQGTNDSNPARQPAFTREPGCGGNRSAVEPASLLISGNFLIGKVGLIL